MRTPTFGEVDLTDCDREPIHIPGSIQPHGVLLAIDPGTLRVVQYAGDAEALLGVDAAGLLGDTLEARLGPAALSGLKTLVAEDQVLPRPFFIFETEVKGRRLDVSAHFSGGLIVLELEPCNSAATDNSIEMVQRMVAAVQATAGVTPLLETIAKQVQQVTGYDRVMVYRFQEDDSGHVVAESLGAPGIDSFLDLHYPASDIPAQAREMYRTNWIRCIPDATYTPAPMEPALNPLNGLPLDLSFSLLRSVSPIHLEYLANMGARASMSLSLVIGGKLWGLVACHHHQPGFISHRVRAACELFAQLASLQLQSQLEVEQAVRGLRSRDIGTALLQSMSRYNLVDGLLRHQPDLMDLVDSTGVAVFTDGEVSFLGETPDPDQVRALCGWLIEHNRDGVFATDRLGDLYPGAAAFAGRVAGVMALAVTREPQDFVLWFRPETIRTVKWGGNPEKPVTLGPNGDRLTPRKSFALWSETVRGRCRPWTADEVEAATRVRVSILEVVLRRLDLIAREREHMVSQQNLLMGELDHRVKNTLATIQALVRITSRTATDLESYTRALERRILSMSHAHSLLTRSRWEGASVRSLVEEELSANMPAEVAARSAMGPDVALEPHAAVSLSLVLHELATNAAKHGALSVPEGQVAVEWSRAVADGREWLRICWVERDGPPVAPPTRTGFGRTLLERIFGADVNGQVDLRFEPEGVVCELSVPYARVVDQAAPAAVLPTPAPLPATASVLGAKVLVVEDRALVAEDVRAILDGAGAHVVGPYHTLDDALQAAVVVDFDVALLDVDLQGSAVWPLARLLEARGSPFVLATGFSESLPRPAGFETTPTVAKPYETQALLAALARVRRSATSE